MTMGRREGLASGGGAQPDANPSSIPIGTSTAFNRCSTQSSISITSPCKPCLIHFEDRRCLASDACSDSLKCKQCRICFDSEEEPDNPLVSPCLCSGGSRFVHRKCLNLWREAAQASGREKGFFTCEVCAYEYQFSRLDGAQWLLHPAFVPVVFTLALSASIWLLGYVPIFETLDCEFVRHSWCRYNKDQCHLFNGSKQCKYSTSLSVSLHLLDGLFMLGQLGLLIYRWKKDPSPVPPPSRPEIEEGVCSIDHQQCCTEEHLTAQENKFGQSWACGCCLLLYSTAVGLTLTVTTLLEWLYIHVDRMATNTAQIIENIERKGRREASTSTMGSSSSWHTVTVATAAGRGTGTSSNSTLGCERNMRCMAKWYFSLCLVAVTMTTIMIFSLMKSDHVRR